MGNEEMTYTRAVEELQQIISEIENEEINVDTLAIKTKRASLLIKFCKAKLKETEDEVKKALAELEETSVLPSEEF